METNKEKKKGNLLMWLLLIFLPPIGIIYMWISKKEFSNNKKSALTIVFAAWFFIVMTYGSNNNTATDTSVSSSTDTETQNEAEVTQNAGNDNNISNTATNVEDKQAEEENVSEETPEKETPEEQQPQLTEEEKEAILEADAVIWNAMLSLDTAFASFSDVLNNNPNLLDLYDSGKALHDAGYNSWNEIVKVNYDGIETYKESAESYALLVESIGDDIAKYADKNEVSYLSSATNNIEQKNTFALKVISDRAEFLAKVGFSMDEITSLLGGSESTE